MQPLRAVLLTFLLMAMSCQKEGGEPAIIRRDLPYESPALSIRLASTSVPSHATDLHFFSETTGVASTIEGRIYRSTDRGLTWTMTYSPAAADQPLHQLLFTDSQTGYAVGGNNGCNGSGCVPPGALLLQTTDGGTTWTRAYAEPKSNFISVAVNAAGHLFLAVNGPKNRILRRTTAGANWAVVDSTTHYLSKLVFNDRAGFYSGSGARLVRSNDQGDTWTHHTSLSYNFVNELAFYQHVGYYVLGYSRVHQTTDNGDTWEEVRHPISSVNKVSVLSPTSCLLWGGGRSSGGDFPAQPGAVGHTQDGGRTWTGVELAEIGPISVASFYSPQQGYAVAGNTLLHITVP